MNFNCKECAYDPMKELSKISENVHASGIERQYIATLKKEMKSKDHVIISLCTKYLKLKSCKRIIQAKFRTLHRHCQEVCENVLKALREHKDSIDLLLDDLVNNTTISPSQEEYIKLVKMNNDLQFENTQLKLYQIPCIYLGENKFNTGTSFQNVKKRIDMNYEEIKPLFSSLTMRSNINYPIDIFSVSKNRLMYNCFSNGNNLRKSISDSDLYLHRDCYT